MNQIIDRFMDKISPEPNSGCWLWDGCMDREGYGHFKIKGIQNRAHRVSYELFCDSIEENKVICHKCDTPSCVNPEHLFKGTLKDNAQDRVKKKRFGHTNKIISEEIKQKIKQETITVKDIAKKYNINLRTVKRIRNSSISL